MKWFLIINLSVCVVYLPLHGMDGLYIKRTIPRASRWDQTKRKEFVRAAVIHLKARSEWYEEELQAPCNEKCKHHLKSEIELDLELLDDLKRCDSESYHPEGNLAQERLVRLQKGLEVMLFSGGRGISFYGTLN